VKNRVGSVDRILGETHFAYRLLPTIFKSEKHSNQNMSKMKKVSGLFLMVFVLLIAGCGKDPIVTPGDDSFVDSRDNHLYKFVEIGTQIWMAENLAYLPSVSPSPDGDVSTPYYYVYGYEGRKVSKAKGTANYATYGALYNWEAAKISCPTGWHLPSDEEWTVLTDFLGAEPGGKMKEAGTAHWQSPNTGATNSSGFNGLPGGYRNSGPEFMWLGERGYYQSTSYWTLMSFGVVRELNSTDANTGFGGTLVDMGLSVRCIKD
jgi:uncharacterized protein (TIGR02145 family)